MAARYISMYVYCNKLSQIRQIHGLLMPDQLNTDFIRIRENDGQGQVWFPQLPDNPVSPATFAVLILLERVGDGRQWEEKGI
jgi:hypothetical protein